MRLIFSGGGTGGHIFPAIAVADYMRKNEGLDISFVGKKDGPEKEVCAFYRFPFEPVVIEGLKRKLSPEIFLVLAKLLAAIVRLYRHIGKSSPDAVVGAGGYVCAPLYAAAILRGVPFIILEQNFTPGLTNRLFSKFAYRVGLPFKGVSFPCDPEKVRYVGNPVRSEFYTLILKEEARKKLNLSPDKKTLLILGGSGGAKKLNEAMCGVIRAFETEKKDLQYIFITGRNQYSRVLENIGSVDEQKVRVIPFLYEMHLAYFAADMAVCRAGGTTISEIICTGLPSILIPYPYATGKHQDHNALYLVNKGAASIMHDGELTAGSLQKEISRILFDPAVLDACRKALTAMADVKPLEKISEMILSLRGR